MKFSQAIEGYLLERLAAGRVEGSIKGIRVRLTTMVRFLGDPDVEKITRQDITRFLAYLQHDYKPDRLSGGNQPIKPTTLTNYHYAISGFFGWAERELGITRPDTNIQRPTGKAEIVTPFTEEQIKALLAVADIGNTSKRNSAIILTFLDCGLRVGELTRLEVGHANLASGEITVKRFASGRKTSGRTVYLARTTRHSIWRYLSNRGEVRPDDALFADYKGGKLNPNGVYQILKRAAVRAGVTDMHPHRFRHTFAIQYLRNGGDVFTLQRLLGHTSLAMVQNYLALANSDSQEAHRKASPVDRWHL